MSCLAACSVPEACVLSCPLALLLILVLVLVVLSPGLDARVLYCLSPNDLYIAKCLRFEFCSEAFVNIFCLHRADLQTTIVLLLGT